MWDRKNLKEAAKSILRARYWISFAVALVAGLIVGGGSGISYQFNFSGYDLDRFTDGQIWQGNIDPFIEFYKNIYPALLTFSIVLVVVSLAIGYAYLIFVGSIVHVGRNRWFSRSRESSAVPAFSHMFSLFRRGSYLGTAGSMAWMYLFLFLWSLLAAAPSLIGWVVSTQSLLMNGSPGLHSDIRVAIQDSLRIVAPVFLATAPVTLALTFLLAVKKYSYWMTPWILADNPTIGYRRALRLSIDMTRGHKWNMFVLELSFLGWRILGVLACCGLGLMFLEPYYQAVQAELYAAVRQDAIDRGLCTMEDFGFIKAQQPLP